MWSDIFYPENPKRREQLIRRSQELQDLMRNNFRATNQLIDAMNKHLSCSFEHIFLNESATLRENCDVIIGCMRKIQAEVERIDKRLKEKLEPTLYEKLRSLSLSTVDFKAISKAFEAVCGIATVGATVLVGYLIDKGFILANITKKFAIIGAGTLASVALAVVFLGIDMIVEAILGKIEGDQLKKALEEYDRALEEFRPASEQYQDKINYVRIKIEVLNE
ncbi:single-pass membrane and coiled-coil domain-containing protein 3-like [Sinocyclocheilus anshuiensis]|uniref:Single-pass membrane and coiled-coil domain-containing protein 3-like n=1 Tax=Sinocyclocheilus anshuiensis TaxID=1608454 RepID=A0A671M4T8_9TELE|nr:PREDICTED: single-pass membrane and coiled-coil domain-containing protein 3-like [Sinocyclocheilus anshuiensis]